MSIPLKVPAIRTYERITFVSGKAIQFFFNMQENLVFPHRFRLSVSFIDMQSGGLLPLLHYLWVNGFPGTHTVLQRPKAVPEERERNPKAANQGSRLSPGAAVSCWAAVRRINWLKWERLKQSHVRALLIDLIFMKY